MAGDQFFSNPRDPGGGDPNAVIIKDISNGSLCAVTGAGARAFVSAVNPALGLRAPTAFPADGNIASTGAFSICSVLAQQAAAIGPAFGGIQVLSPGVEVNLRGNKLPQAPNLKASVGAQYTVRFDNGMTVIPRFDLALTGEQFGNVFNGRVNRIEPFVQANAQIQFNGPDNRFFVRGFVQNIFDANSITGLYVTDASSGNFTNIFARSPALRHRGGRKLLGSIPKGQGGKGRASRPALFISAIGLWRRARNRFRYRRYRILRAASASRRRHK